MCTLSWLPLGSDYVLGFNRDESLVRGPEVPVAVRESDGVCLVAPLDSEQGGTWIAANEFGGTVAVLNRYQPSSTPRPAPRVSRGQLVLALSSSPAPVDVRRRLEETRLTDYQPFTLAAVGPGSPVYLFGWDGATMTEQTTATPGLVALSSAVSAAEAARARHRALSEIQGTGPLTPAVLDRFHRSHLPTRGSLSPCMHRDDAETRSYCRVNLTESAVELRHVPGAPCTCRESVTGRLVRRPQPSPLAR